MLKRFVKKIKKDGFGDAIYVIWREIVLFYKRWMPFPLKITYYIHLIKLILFPNKKCNNKRILGIWDYNCMPFSVGDILLFVQALSVIKLEHDAKFVDIAIVYNKNNPINGRTSNLTKDNAQDYFIEYLPLFACSPYLGSVLQFNEHDEFDSFFNSNIDRYITYPSLNKHLGETFNYGRGDFDIKVLLDDFFVKYKYMPNLRIGDRDMIWAYVFCRKHLAKNQIPVTISLKNTIHAQHRNADPGVWISFLTRCAEAFPEIKFVQVGLRGEEFAGVRNLKNAIIAKDYGSSISEDFALIKSSVLYMGTTSGISKIAEFSETPFLLFKMEPINMNRLDLKNGKGYIFSSHLQKFYDSSFNLTTESLFDEFSKVYKELDLNEWRKRIKINASGKHPHPSTQLKGKNV